MGREALHMVRERQKNLPLIPSLSRRGNCAVGGTPGFGGAKASADRHMTHSVSPAAIHLAKSRDRLSP